MLEIWFRLLTWLKRIWFKNPNDSNFLSHHFKFKKWLIFISIALLITFNFLVVYRLFTISANFLVYKEQTQKELVACKAKIANFKKDYYDSNIKDVTLVAKNNLLDTNGLRISNINNELLKKLLEKDNIAESNKKILVAIISLNKSIDSNHSNINQKIKLLSAQIVNLENKR